MKKVCRIWNEARARGGIYLWNWGLAATLGAFVSGVVLKDWAFFGLVVGAGLAVMLGIKLVDQAAADEELRMAVERDGVRARRFRRRLEPVRRRGVRR